MVAAFVVDGFIVEWWNTINGWVTNSQFRGWHDFLESIVACVTIAGIPIAIWTYRSQKTKDREADEYATYNALDAKYTDYLNICLAHPDLDVFDLPITGYQPQQAHPRQESIIFAILIAILERAYLMYEKQDTEIKQTQWSGWDDYANQWANRDNFCAAWRIQGNEFDLRFQSYMSRAIRDAAAKKAAAQPQPPPAGGNP
jgi:hypothetical protein